MKLVSARVDGFGKLIDRSFAFDPRLTIVVGPNEAGKSTLSSALLALLYGLGRTRDDDRDRWRPWSGDTFGGAVVYELSDGRRFEVQRAFDRDNRAVRVYDESGIDRSGDVTINKLIAPAHAHLRVPREVFVNASFSAQGEVAIDGARAERISSALAQALDGGPREDAALGALGRLDLALATHVGTKRATVNTPLRTLKEEIDDARESAADMRARLERLDHVRARLQADAQRAQTLDASLREYERRGKALRAQTLATRLERLRDLREEVADLHRTRAAYDDVADFPSSRVPELEGLFHEWRAAETIDDSAARDAASATMSAADRAHLDELLTEGGALGADAYAALEAEARTAHEAQTKATFAANAAQAARRAVDGGNELFGAAFASAAFVAVGAALLVAARLTVLATAATVLALLIAAFAASRWARRRVSLRRVAEMQALADAAASIEARAAATLAAVLEPLGARSMEELAGRRARAAALLAKRADMERTAARAREARAAADRAAGAFDRLARELVPASGSRRAALAAAQERGARRTARDGIDAQLSMFDLRRADALGDEDEFALQAELEELLAAGAMPAAAGEIVSQRAFDAQRAALEADRNDAREAVVAGNAQLGALEGEIGDVAALDEKVALLCERERELERFAEAVGLARRIVDERTREAHQKFARRLADYASTTLANVTGGRYGEVFVEPTTLQISVRVPETNAIEPIERLSAGTREQTFLVVRLAMARMFAEGCETQPLLLDDPFAYWDDERIERALPAIEAAARDAQAIVFTSSERLAEASRARGAGVIELNVVSAEAVVRSAAG